MEQYKQYFSPIPAFLRRLAETPPMERLKGIGMNCGCEYTAFPRFQGLQVYSRFDHSLGVALLVWRCTGSEAQAAAGLLHDVATPVFAHVVDFLRGDHLTQEATEDGTREMIDASPALQAALHAQGLSTQDVCDYHRYPIADNDSPRLSADRLEYTLGNSINYGFWMPARRRWQSALPALRCAVWKSMWQRMTAWQCSCLPSSWGGISAPACLHRTTCTPRKHR